MKSYLFPMLLLAGCAAAPEPEPQPTRSSLEAGFVGQRFAWDHDSGVSGETIHYADGTMVYDRGGTERTSRYTLSVADRYCMNAGDYDQVCFTLVQTPTGYASEDGTFRYDRLPDAPLAASPYDPASPYDSAPIYDEVPAYDESMGYDASIYLDAPSEEAIFGESEDLPIVSSPID